MNLSTARRIKGVSQVELDRLANLPKGTVNDIEAGRNKRPAWVVVKALADALGVRPEEVFPTDREAA